MAVPVPLSPPAQPRPLSSTSLFKIHQPLALTSSVSLFPTFSCPPKRLSLSPASSSQYRTTIKAARTTAANESDPKLGVSLYKPKSYEVLVTDAANSLFCALNDGKTRLEIEFPPLPSNMSSYKGSSDEFSDANIQLALAVVKKLQEKTETRACIVFPDKPEKRRATELFKAAFDSIEGLTIGSLDDMPAGPITTFLRSVRNTLDFDFEDENEGRWKSDKPPSIYIFISSSTRDLSVIEKKNLPPPLLPFFSIWSLTRCVLTLVFLAFQRKIYITDSSLSLLQFFTFEQENTQSGTLCSEL